MILELNGEIIKQKTQGFKDENKETTYPVTPDSSYLNILPNNFLGPDPGEEKNDKVNNFCLNLFYHWNLSMDSAHRN
jgi:hypothetical protein